MPHVVIVGAGFGGLNTAKLLARRGVNLTIIDRKNHYTFQPLLYQVALAVLSPAEIASPIRAIFHDRRNVEVLLAEVTGFDLAAKRVTFADGASIAYDYLIVAAGATHAYFGHDEWAPLAPGLKSIEDALDIRRRVLLAFENAEKQAALTGKAPGLNFVVIGGGPTGVELAGAISDIARKVMRNDFRYIDPRNARVLLLEGGPRLLSTYPEDLSASAQRQLIELGVEVRTGTLVTGVEPDLVRAGSEQIASSVTLWAAGVAASPLGRKLGVATDRVGRVLVHDDLSIPGHNQVFVVGDLAAYSENGHPIPGVAPAAMQMGRFAARQVLNDMSRKPREKFHYNDKGSLATIGRSRAVGTVKGLHLTRYIAWLAWSLIHILYLITFRSKLIVMIEWAWSYFRFYRGARLITDRNL